MLHVVMTSEPVVVQDLVLPDDVQETLKLVTGALVQLSGSSSLEPLVGLGLFGGLGLSHPEGLFGSGMSSGKQLFLSVMQVLRILSSSAQKSQKRLNGQDGFQSSGGQKR